MQLSRYLYPILLFASMIFSQQQLIDHCNNKTDVYLENCLNLSLCNPEAVCDFVFDPVCGCDGNSYSNSCFAQLNAVQSWTSGMCVVEIISTFPPSQETNKNEDEEKQTIIEILKKIIFYIIHYAINL